MSGRRFDNVGEVIVRLDRDEVTASAVEKVREHAVVRIEKLEEGLSLDDARRNPIVVRAVHRLPEATEVVPERAPDAGKPQTHKLADFGDFGVSHSAGRTSCSNRPPRWSIVVNYRERFSSALNNADRRPFAYLRTFVIQTIPFNAVLPICIRGRAITTWLIRGVVTGSVIRLNNSACRIAIAVAQHCARA